jgi:hypothetical protein
MTASASTANVEASWSAVENLTTAMRSAAGNESWSEVVELAAARHETLQRHFEHFPVGPANATFYQRHLTTLLNREKELQELAVAARKEIMRQSSTLQRNKRSVMAYLR